MTIVTIIGNATADPELRYLQSGIPVANVNVAVNERKKEGDQWVDGEPTFFRVAAWRQLGEHLVASVTKGQQIIVTGRLVNREYEVDGQRRTSLEIEAQEVGASLRFGTTTFTKASPQGQPQQGGQQQWPAQAPQQWPAQQAQPAQQGGGQWPARQGQPQSAPQQGQPGQWAGPNSGFVPQHAGGAPVPPPQGYSHEGDVPF